jgi:two-component system response regulator ResD
MADPAEFGSGGQGTRATVLLVEDERDQRLVTAAYLQSNGCAVIEAGTAAAARQELGRREIDVMVLDLGLPDRDGLDLLRTIDRGIRVIVVSGRGEEPDRVVGLELGADDYLTKPYSQRELLARIKAVLRRSDRDEVRQVLRYGKLAIDTAARETFVLSRPVALTRREYELLLCLASKPGRTFSREELLNTVWDSSAQWQGADTVSEHVYRLRRKLGLAGQRPTIATVHGVGYRFDP